MLPLHPSAECVASASAQSRESPGSFPGARRVNGSLGSHTGTLGAAVGDESRLIFGEYSFFISLLCEHPFVGNRDGADWFIDEHPSPHAPELLKFGLDRVFPLWPVGGFARFFQAVAVVSGDYCEGFLFGH